MAQGTGFQGTYKVTPKSKNEVKPGNWYYGFDCLECGSRFAVFDDKSMGKKAVSMGGGGQIRSACPECGVDRLYATDQIVQFEAVK